ncbi:small RNA 2'-O-methyltransferase-like [Typha angustifolia]|uniref:small RNA 2'-O-methyltransferase-like n=1 Tax=Typha angustifolia TaxID=59011 RepID=UPI003C2FEF30
MGTEATPAAGIKKPVLTPKALIHQKYGSRACYRIEEVQHAVGNVCPGLVIQQQVRSLYRCCLDLPDLSVTSDTFTRKKDAEQSAAQIAVEKLGIQAKANSSTPEEAWNELVARISGLFTDEFLSSSHPLVGHFRVALRKEGDLFGMIPMSVIAACDVKVNSLCRIIDPKAESDAHIILLLISKAAKVSGSVCIIDDKFWIWKGGPYSSEAIESSLHHSSDCLESVNIEAIRIPCALEEEVGTLSLLVSDTKYYMDEIAKKLNVNNSSEVLISKTVGKASSEIKLYFPTPDGLLSASDSSNDPLGIVGDVKMGPLLNKRASYLSGQNIYGDAILANVGYTWRSTELFCEDVSLSAYYRMLVSKLPDGSYKLSREAILAAELPAVYTTRSNWKGSFPRDLLCLFCRQQRLLEPIFSVRNVNALESSPGFKEINTSELTEVQYANEVLSGVLDRDLDTSSGFQCEVKIFSKRQEVLIEYSSADTYRKESDAIQSSALKVLAWFKKYFKQLDMPMEELSSFGSTDNIKVHPIIFSQELAASSFVYDFKQMYITRNCSSFGSLFKNQSNLILQNGMILLNVEGPDSGVYPSSGSLTCISYAASLVREEDTAKIFLESNDEFEFEIGTGAVINQIEACVTQMSVNQVAQFVVELPSRDMILAAAGESANSLSQLSLRNCFLEFSVKVLCVTEPLEDRMEKALFNPPLSKQRVEFAVRHINESHAATLVDFGCGSGSLLDSLLEHTTSLEKIIGVDISHKSLTRAAKILHQKLTKNSVMQTCIRSTALYDGSITEFDSRLFGFDIGTCLEVIEHMEEDQACLFGDVALNLFCPRILIISTPNYEYNPILQRSASGTKEDDLEEKSGSCKFRNHDHKFEWTREQFEQWATNLAVRHDYSVQFSGVGGSGDVEPGFASQIAVFRRNPSHWLEEKCLPDGDSSHPYELVWEWTNKSL